MATFSKELLSGSTGGKSVKVAATATTGTTIHSTLTSNAIKDEIWLWATNQDVSPVVLTLEWGGTTDPDDRVTLTIPSKAGFTIVVEGLLLVGTGSVARTITAYAATANKVMLHGFVNRIT